MQLGGLGERCKLPQWGDLMHIQGQNNSSSSNIFVRFAEERIKQNIDFQPQKVGGQRIGFAYKD